MSAVLKRLWPQVKTYKEARRDFEQQYWHALIAQTNGNIAECGRIAGVTRQDCYKRFSRFGIVLPQRATSRQIFKTDRRVGAYDRRLRK